MRRGKRKPNTRQRRKDRKEMWRRYDEEKSAIFWAALTAFVQEERPPSFFLPYSPVTQGDA